MHRRPCEQAMHIPTLVLLATVAVSTGSIYSLVGVSLFTGYKPQVFEDQEAEIEDFPYMLSLKVGSEQKQAAILINQHWALTLASYVDPADLSSIILRAGSTLREYGGQLRLVKKLVIHPEFKNDSLFYNFVLMRVDYPFVFNEKVYPIELPKQGYDVPAYTKANVSGWANVNDDIADFSMSLKYSQVNVLGDLNCKMLTRDWTRVKPRFYCSNVIEEGKNPCAGDRGGPLVADDMLIGVVISDICDQESTLTNIYARVADQRKWIDSVVNEKSKCSKARKVKP